MAIPDADSIVTSLSKHWPYRRGLVGAVVAALGIESPLLASTNTLPHVWLLTFLITAVAIFITWYFSRSLPKTKSNKVGFVVSISSDEEAETKRIRADFVITLQRLLKAGKTGQKFQFIEVPNYYADRVVDLDEAQKLRVETRAHFVLYGRVRLRNLNKKEHHFIELDGVVAHKAVPDSVSRQIAEEFSELLPRKVAIPTDDDLFAFEFTSEWAEVVAKYIIGIAASVSGDLKYAEELYSNVLEKINATDNKFPIFEKLRQRVPKRLFEIFEVHARAAYYKWTSNHDPQELENMWAMLGKIDTQRFGSPSFSNLMSICYFLRDRDTTSASTWLNKIPKQDRESVWHLNQAFLHAYQGDLKAAIRQYRHAADMPITPEAISEVEDFLIFIVTNEPNKYQLHYCLGFFNWQIKGDNLQAISDLEKFLELESDGQFTKERELAIEWLKEIKIES